MHAEDHSHNEHGSGFMHRVRHFLHDAWHHIWNTLLTINSILIVIASFYTIYAAGASIYYFTFRPLEIGVIITIVLIIIELIIAAIEEVWG